MRKILIALAMATIAISLFIVIPNAYGFTLGYIGTDGNTSTDNRQVFSNFTLTVPVGYKIQLQKFYVYCNNNTATGNVEGLVYDNSGWLVGRTGQISVNGLGTYNANWNLYLLSGTYTFGVQYIGCDWKYVGSTYETNHTTTETVLQHILTFDDKATWTSDYYSTYDYAVLADPLTTTVDVNWMAFIVLLAFSIINISLMLMPRIYLLNFVVGVLTLAFAAVTVNDATLPVQPYFSLIVSMVAVLGILRAGTLMRNQ